MSDGDEKALLLSNLPILNLPCATGRVRSMTVVGSPDGPSSAELVVNIVVNDKPTTFHITSGTAPQVFSAVTSVLCLAVTQKKPVTVWYQNTPNSPTIVIAVLGDLDR